MGKGDKKSRKGKIARGSYGVTRPRKKTNTAVSSPAPKAKAKKEEKVGKAAEAVSKAEKKPVAKRKTGTKKTTKKTVKKEP